MLRKQLLVLLLLLHGALAFSRHPAESPGTFIKVDDGIIVFPDPGYTLNTHAVRVRVVSDKIIHVSASPEKDFAPFRSLATVELPPAPVTWTVDSAAGKVVITTQQLRAVVMLRTGAVSFYDPAGNTILSERPVSGRSFEPTAYEGQRSYHITQVFQTSADDAIYGLGQHQDDAFNYRGNQVRLFQNNTEVGVPFLISSKNYGILWDNYSITTIGDIRPYHPLSAFQLSSAGKEQGWLTARYYNDTRSDAPVVVERAETDIRYEYLDDSRLHFPASFEPQKGKVVWEGSIASDFEGTHRIRMLYGGYIKIWIGGKLVLDRWRKAWNAANGLIDVDMQKGRRYPVKIEWIPESDQAYLSFNWIEPVPADERDSYAFSSEAGKQMNYYFIHGENMDDVIGGYRRITGKAPIMPKWAMGFWQSRERYKTQDEILNTVSEFRKRKIPLDNIVLDWSYWKENDWGSQEFDASRFPNPDSMIDVLHSQYNTKFMISVWPKFYEGIDAYRQFDARGWLYKRNIADKQRDWIGKGYVSTFYDAFNADARKGFWDLIHSKIYTKGIDAWWMDASEPDIHSNVSPEKRKQQMVSASVSPAAEYLNAYPLQNAKGIYEGQRSADPGKRVFLLTRSGFAGSQRYAAAIWSGDIGATWHDMKAQIPAGINLSMSGIPYWTMDIGGFVVERRFEKPDEKNLEEWRELLTRWYQFGAFAPLFRSHGQYPYREIFNIAPDDHPAYKSILYYNRLRYRLMPYLYSISARTHHHDYTIMRGLPMDFAADTAVRNIGDQYMFGPSLLVSPVYEYRQRERDLYLPAGQGWYDLYNGTYYEGGQRLKVAADYGRMPVFVKEGSIVPFGPELQYTDEKPADTISLFVYTGSNGDFEIYEDENNNYNYEKGSFSTIPISYNEQRRILTIGERKGAFPGMIANRVFNINWISRDKPAGVDLRRGRTVRVNYSGKALTVKIK